MGLELKNGANDTPILGVYGEVGLDFTADDFRKALDTIPARKEIEVRIHSPGGNYYEGIAIHTNLARRNVRTVVDGLAASAGSLIAMAGQRIEMAEGSWLMIHEVHGSLIEETSDQFRVAADRIDAANEEIRKIYSRRWKGNKQELRDAMRAETWYTSADAIAAGLVDAVEPTVAMAARVDWSKFGYIKVPEALLRAVSAEKPIIPALSAVASVVAELFPEPEAA